MLGLARRQSKPEEQLKQIRIAGKFVHLRQKFVQSLINFWIVCQEFLGKTFIDGFRRRVHVFTIEDTRISVTQSLALAIGCAGAVEWR